MSMVNTYEQYVRADCDDVRSEILDGYTVADPEPRAIYETVMLHHHVHTALDTRDRDHGVDQLRTFRGTLAIGSGNCEEKSIVLTSLLREVPRAYPHFVTVSNRLKQGHALVVVRFNDYDDPHEVSDRLREAYDDVPEIDASPGEIHWEVTNGIAWFVADPIKSAFVGDLSVHLDEGYAAKREDYWEWHRVKERGVNHPK